MTIPFATIAALFGALVVLALVPGVSVLAVSARAAASGFSHGAFVTLGILAGDLLFILVAVMGLSLLAGALDGAFVVVKLLGAAYLIWLAYSLWRNEGGVRTAAGGEASSLASSFMSGLLITLADQKAILFYLGFFPAFVDLASITAMDAVLVVLVSIVAVGGVKLGYAALAARAGMLVPRGGTRTLSRVAAVVLVVVAVVLLAGT